MITLSPATLFLLYLATSLTILLYLWVRSTARAHHRRIIPPEHTLIQCEYCSERYFAPADHPLTRCPQCHLVLKP